MTHSGDSLSEIPRPKVKARHSLGDIQNVCGWEECEWRVDGAREM